MNKRFLSFVGLVLIAILFFYACGGPKSRNVTLRVNFSKFHPGDTVLLIYDNDDTVKKTVFREGVAVDTVVLDSTGSFLYTKKVSQVLHYKILYPMNGRMVMVGAGVFLDADTTELEVDSLVNSPNSLKVKVSGPVQQDFLAYQEYIRPLARRADSLQNVGLKIFTRLSRAGKNPPKALQDEMEDIRNKFFNMFFESQTLDSLFILKHSKSVVSAWLLNNVINSIDNSPAGKQAVLERVELLLSSLDKSLSSSVYFKNIEKVLKKLQALSKGAVAPDFKLPTPAGDSVSLSSFKGKVLVLDFWASWCGPCRFASPRMVALYNKYKDKGVEFFGVSLDSNKDEWIEAIKKDKLSWANVSELKGWNSFVAALYQVHAIPATFLIDREGHMIGSFTIEDLERGIEEALKK